MRLTIIPVDKTVYVNENSISGLILNNIPTNLHTLQWDNDKGWLEFKDNKPNKSIDKLPEWAWEAHAVFTNEIENAKVQEITEKEIEDYALKVALIEDTYPVANIEAVEKLLAMRFKNITTFPRIRKSDRSIIGVDVSSLVGTNNTGSIGMLSAKSLVKAGQSLGVPIISDSTPQGVDLVHFESVLQSFGLSTISSPVALYAYVPWTLTMEKVSKKILIEKERDIKINGGITYNGNVFDSDVVARENILSTLAIVAAGVALPPDFVWRTKNNNNVVINDLDIVNLASEMNKIINDAYHISWERKSNLINAVTFEEIRAI